MAFQKINSFTWIKANGTKSKDEILRIMENKSFPKIEKTDPLQKKNGNQTLNYRKFCKKVFEDRKFISLIDFNKMINKSFNQNSTYYRKRMIDLKLITVKNKVVYKYDNSQKSEILKQQIEK